MQRKLRVAVLLAGVLSMNSAAVRADDSFIGWLLNFERTKEVKPVTSKQYQEECGACHFAYPPGLLPARSWEKLLTAGALHNHFGDDAELDAPTLEIIRDYALENAADKSWYKRSRKIAHGISDGDAPLRITEVRYIKRMHQEIPEKMISGNKDVKSLSYCDKCHTQADKGVFDNDTVQIPNFGN